VGRRPVGNVRKLAPDAFRLRYREPDGEMCTSPVTYRSKEAAVRALWLLASEGQVHLEHDRRFRVLVLLATFASLRWGEVTALAARTSTLRCVPSECGTARRVGRRPDGSLSSEVAGR
jgi:hypothetical protein